MAWCNAYEGRNVSWNGWSIFGRAYLSEVMPNRRQMKRHWILNVAKLNLCQLDFHPHWRHLLSWVSYCYTYKGNMPANYLRCATLFSVYLNSDRQMWCQLKHVCRLDNTVSNWLTVHRSLNVSQPVSRRRFVLETAGCCPRWSGWCCWVVSLLYVWCAKSCRMQLTYCSYFVK